MTTADAAHTAALLLARVDGGILTAAETAPVAAVVENVLGADLLAELRGLWREALDTADDDADTMIDLGRRWCAGHRHRPRQPRSRTPARPATPTRRTGRACPHR